MRKLTLPLAAVGLAAVLAAPVAQAAEVKLKGISAWPKNFPLTADFLRRTQLRTPGRRERWQVW